MKKSLLILAVILYSSLLSAQCNSTIRAGSVDASTLTIGDTIYIPIYCDDVDNLVVGLALRIYFDPEVISWTGTPIDPLLGVSYFHPNMPYNPADWLFNDEGSAIVASWVDPAYTGVQVNPGDIILIFRFVYHGGETPLTWDLTSEFCGTTTLINGCVCSPFLQPVVFHVLSDDNNLQDAEVTVGNETQLTNSSGNAVFYLNDGDYTFAVTKEGYTELDSSFTVAGAPVQIEVEMEVCYDITFHLSIGGVPLQGFMVIVGNDTLISNSNGFAVFCLSDGDYSYTVTKIGYEPLSGSFTVSGSPITIELLIYSPYGDVVFFITCCNEPVEGIPITIGTTTIVTGGNGIGIFSLPAGTYNYIAGSLEGTFTVPPNTTIHLDICGEITFHVTGPMSNPLQGALININGGYLLTDSSGEADTCLQTGAYSYTVTKLGFVAQTGSFIVDTVPQTVDIIMPLQEWQITFGISGLPCLNQFEGLIFIINGDTVLPGQSIYLPNGSYSGSLHYIGCPLFFTIGEFIVNNANMTIEYVFPPGATLPQITFHIISSSGGGIANAKIIIDGVDSLYTNSLGETSFCMTGGEHNYSVTKEGYDTITGNFIFPCEDITISFLMNPVTIKDFNTSCFRIFPNPSDGKFYIENSSLSNDLSELSITDLTGRLVYQNTVTLTNKIEIDLGDKQKGMYFLQVKAENKTLNRKIIIR